LIYFFYYSFNADDPANQAAGWKLEYIPEAVNIAAGLEAKPKVRAKAEEAEDLWDAARLEALAVY
jgi:hypothetical protein